MTIAAPITDRATLKTAIADYLDRNDLTNRIDVFVQAAESKIKRQLQRASVVVTVSLTQASTTLSASYAELRSMRLITGSPSRDVPIRVVTPEMLAEFRAFEANTAGRPRYASIIAGAPGATTLLVTPAPDQAYTAELIAYSALVPLSSMNPTSPLLSEAPDIYLYGSLAAGCLFLEDSDNAQMWAGMFDDAIAQLNKKSVREESSASLRPMRLPTSF